MAAIEASPNAKENLVTIRKFYTIFDIAKMFNRSSTTIRRWIRNGSFPRGKAVPGGMIWTEEVTDR